MAVTKNITLSSHKQLVDLNGDKVNFNLTFEVKTQNSEPFEVVVVTQTILDSENEVPIEYKEAKDGYISGNIVSDKNKYENYFLLLKADKSVECTVTINLQDIQPNIPQNLPEQNPLPPTPPGMNTNLLASKPQDSEKAPSKFPWVTVIIIALILIGGGLAWYFLIYKKKAVPGFTQAYIPPQQQVVLDAGVAPVIVQQPVVQQVAAPIVQQSAENLRHQELLDKINSVPLWQEPI